MSIVEPPPSTDDDAIDALHYTYIKLYDEENGTQYCINEYGLDIVENLSLIKRYLQKCPSNITNFTFKQKKWHTLRDKVKEMLPDIHKKANEKAQKFLQHVMKEEKVRSLYLSDANYILFIIFIDYQCLILGGRG